MTNLQKGLSLSQSKELLLVIVLSIIFFMACGPQSDKTDQEEWISLFNGKDIEGWDIKITGYELNDNFGNTFRVEDGILKVSYDEYEEFGGRFAHIYYNEPFSHYKLRVEYRFVDDQVEGGPGWAFRNNGIMFHSQAAKEIELMQNFPISVEAQLLGGDGENERPNGNVCTPGTSVVIDGVRRPEHCIETNSRTFHGDDWVTFEMIVYGDSLVHHILEGDTVLTYTDIQLEESGNPLSKGYIALQGESHPTQFRKIEILDLSPR